MRALLLCLSTATALQRPPAVAVARRRLMSAAATSVVVECAESDDEVRITLGGRTLQRTATEPLAKSLGRLAGKAKKGKTKGAPPAPPPVPPRLLDAAGAEISPDTPARDAWAAARALELDGARLPVRVNPPSITALACYGEPTVGVELLAACALKNAAPADAAYRWYVDGAAVGDGDAYTPAAAGGALRVEARVGDDDPIFADLGFVVFAAPRPEHAARLAALGPPRPGEVRVLTYNVLADAFRHTWDAGIHTHCAAPLTVAGRRAPIAVAEVLSYGPSIACLQEVDDKWWTRVWEPRLARAGYGGELSLKSGTSAEGVATAWDARA